MIPTRESAEKAAALIRAYRGPKDSGHDDLDQLEADIAKALDRAVGQENLACEEVALDCALECYCVKEFRIAKAIRARQEKKP